MANKVTKKVEQKSDPLAITEDLTSKLLDLMGTKTSISVKKDEESDAILINIEGGEETGLIIGNRGMTLIAIQTVVGMMLKKKIGEWKRVIVDVAGGRRKCGNNVAR